MTPPDVNPKLTQKIERTDRVIKYSFLGAVFFILLGLVVIIIQLVRIQDTIEANLVTSREAAAENHRKTQKYVKCVAQQMLKPLSQRKANDLERCGIDSTPQTEPTTPTEEQNQAANIPPSLTTLPVIRPTTPTTVTPPTPPVTTSDPPKQTPPVVNPLVTEPSQPAQLQRPGLVSGLVDGLGGLVNRLGL